MNQQLISNAPYLDFGSDQTIADGAHIYDEPFHEEVMIAMDILIIFMVILGVMVCKLPLCFVVGVFIGRRKSKIDACPDNNNQCLSPDELV